MASRLFAPASSERVDNSGSLRASEVKDTPDNEPTKRRSSSLVGDLAASILGADVLAARPGGPDDRRSVAVQLQLPPNGGRCRPRLRGGAAGLRRRPDGHSRSSGGRRRRADGPQVVNGAITRARTPLSKGTGRHESREGEGTTSLAASALLLDDLGPQLRRGLLDAQPQILRVDGVHCRRRGRRSTRVPGVARRV